MSARRLLAYAAGIGDHSAAVLDDAGTLVACPSFCVSLEWPVQSHPDVCALLGAELSDLLRGVHVTQDSHFHRPIRPDMQVHTRAVLTGVRNTRAGALGTHRADTGDADGPLVSSWVQTLYRGVAVDGEAREIDPAPSLPAPPESHREAVKIPIAREAAHVYTECAQIWNPIHTERRVALAAGLPDIILHGTATWALAGREIVARCAGGDPTRLARLHGRFRAMVVPGCEVRLEFSHDEEHVHFRVLNDAGKDALSHGYARIRPSAADADR